MDMYSLFQTKDEYITHEIYAYMVTIDPFFHSPDKLNTILPYFLLARIFSFFPKKLE